MPLNDLYVLTLDTVTGDGVVMRQDFSYQVSFTTLGAQEAELLNLGFETAVASGIAAIVHTDTYIRGSACRNLFYPTVYHEYNYSPYLQGERTGQSLPTFVAASFSSAKPAYGQRGAKKRFGTLSEADTQGNGLQDTTGYFTALDTLAEQLGTPIQSTQGLFSATFNPVVIHRVKETINGKVVYRYPTNDGEAESYLASNWTWSNEVGSQLTRKKGRGM